MKRDPARRSESRSEAVPPREGPMDEGGVPPPRASNRAAEPAHRTHRLAHRTHRLARRTHRLAHCTHQLARGRASLRRERRVALDVEERLETLERLVAEPLHA